MDADTTERLPRYLAPLPRRIETVALQYAWVIVAINLAGTAFCFWYSMNVLIGCWDLYQIRRMF